jgi:tetratricopeptide (TPR) repeat protein
LGIGLVIWGVFSWIYDFSPSGILKTAESGEIPAIRQENSKRLNKVIAIAGLGAILLLIAGSFWAGSRWNNPETIEVAQLAVIPIKSSEGFSEDDFFSHGFTQDLIEELSQLGGLTVLNLGSSKYFDEDVRRSQQASLAPLVQDVGQAVDFYIYGDYVKQGNTVQLTLFARRGMNSTPFWTDSYKSDITYIPSLTREISADISREIGLEPEIVARIFEKEIRPVNPDTYELYLKGKYYIDKSSLEDLQRGLVYFQEAVDKNPADPYAYAGLAEGYISLAHNIMAPDDVFPKGLEAAKRAIQLDSNSAEGWAALADYHTYFGWDWELADYAFKRANELNPNLAMNHYHRAWYLHLFDRIHEAIAEHIRAQQLDPFTIRHTAWLGELYRTNGEYDKALEELRKAEKMRDDNALSKSVKARVMMDLDDPDSALALLKQAGDINPGWRYLSYGPALILMGKEEGLEIKKEVLALPKTAFLSSCLAAMYFNSGEVDSAFYWLDRGKSFAWYPWYVKRGLGRTEVRNDPRYVQLMRELNLTPLEMNGMTEELVY